MLGCYTLLLDIMSSLSFEYDWITLDNVSKLSSSLLSLENWIVHLATIQVIIARDLLSAGIRKFLQTDRGHLGQEVRLLSFYDLKKRENCSNLDSPHTHWKKSEEVTIGIKYSLALFCPSGKIDGLSSNSGQGIPESFGKACVRYCSCRTIVCML